MGTSYDGVYFCGLVFDGFGEDDGDEGWPEATLNVFAELPNPFDDAERADDFEPWLDAVLGIEPDASYDVREAQRRERCLARFGVEGWQDGWIGHIDYPVYYVAPLGASIRQWRGGQVPSWTEEQVETWKAACHRLRDMLPGAGEPGLYFGCQVG